MHRFQKAFTLIELLVVVAIIAVLLALLMPALDKAIYQAELAVCGAQLKGIGNMASTYAMDYQRTYPYRGALHDNEVANYQPSQLTWFAEDRTYDDRNVIRGHTTMKVFNCPLSGRFDANTQDPNSFVYSNYLLWFGYRYTQAATALPATVPTSVSPTNQYSPQPGMMRLGDRWAFGTRRFTWLANDQELWGGFGSWNAHPDLEGYSANTVLQDSPSAAFVGARNPQGKYATSYWSGPARGTTDNNYVDADGSITRFQHKEPAFFQPWETVGLTALPNYNQSSSGGLLVKVQQ